MIETFGSHLVLLFQHFNTIFVESVSAYVLKHKATFYLFETFIFCSQLSATVKISNFCNILSTRLLIACFLFILPTLFLFFWLYLFKQFISNLFANYSDQMVQLSQYEYTEYNRVCSWVSLICQITLSYYSGSKLRITFPSTSDAAWTWDPGSARVCLRFCFLSCVIRRLDGRQSKHKHGRSPCVSSKSFPKPIQSPGIFSRVIMR